jgi:hypothetical protein
MEIKGATFLYTLAGLMITYAGFSALLLGLRQASGSKLSLLDRYLAKTVMSYIVVLTAAALLPELLSLYGIEETRIWWWSGVIFGVPMLLLQATYPVRRRRVVGRGPPPVIFAVFVLLGSAVTAAMLGSLVLDIHYGAALYITAVTADFFTVAFGYLTALDVIMQQPPEQVDGPPQRQSRASRG